MSKQHRTNSPPADLSVFVFSPTIHSQTFRLPRRHSLGLICKVLMRTLFCMAWLASQFSGSCEGTYLVLEEMEGGWGRV